MSNNYILSVLDSNNEFRVEADFILLDIMAFGVNAKLDTGCTYTNIPVKTMGGLTDREILAEKRNDLINKTVRHISRGVETDVKNLVIPKTLKDALLFKNFTFEKLAEDLTICGVNLGNIKVNVSYDFNNNILIGMDIMQNWDIHMDKSIKTGKYTLIACPKDKLNDEYYKALDEHFNLGNKILSATI